MFPLKLEARQLRGDPQGRKAKPTHPQSIPTNLIAKQCEQSIEKLVARRIAKASLIGALGSTQFGTIENRFAIDALFAITHAKLVRESKILRQWLVDANVRCFVLFFFSVLDLIRQQIRGHPPFDSFFLVSSSLPHLVTFFLSVSLFP